MDRLIEPVCFYSNGICVRRTARMTCPSESSGATSNENRNMQLFIKHINKSQKGISMATDNYAVRRKRQPNRNIKRKLPHFPSLSL